MNGQYGDRFTPLSFGDKNEKDSNVPLENSDPFADKFPAAAEIVAELPVGATLVDAGPLSEPRASVVPFYDAPVKEDPAEAMVPVVGLPDEAIAYRAATGESIGENWGTKPLFAGAPMAEQAAVENPVSANSALSTALLDSTDSEHFRTHWNEIQARFVDEPRTAVQQADALVTEVVEKITQMFASEHTSLDSQWNQGNEVSTEDLRKALQRYRSFFNRLVV